MPELNSDTYGELEPRSRRGRHATITLMTGLIAVGVLFILLRGLVFTPRRPALPAALPPGTPVILITIDTLREDHTGSGGNDRDATPFLDGFARQSIRFSRCFSQCSWTLPSILSLMSSLSPPVFGIRDGVAPIPRPGERISQGGETVRAEIFSEDHLTLPEILHSRGYRTVGISTNGHLIRRQGCAQGFDVFNQDDCMWGTADCALGRAMEEIDRGSDHLFVWVHLMDPHFDNYGKPPLYLPPPGYEHLFASSSKRGVAERAMLDYDRKIRYTDDQLGLFFHSLSEKGITDRALVIIAADHGEEFNEKQRWGHSKAVTNSLIHVPLQIHLPGSVGGGIVIDQPVRNLDVMPTVLDLLGLPIPAAAEGMSLRGLIEGRTPPPYLVYAETRRMGQDIRCLIDPATDMKLVLHMKSDYRELYDISRDRYEEWDLARSLPERADELDAILREQIAKMESRAVLEETDQVIPESELERLRNLGYIGG